MPDKKDYSWVGIAVMLLILVPLAKTSFFRDYIQEISKESSRTSEIISSIDIYTTLMPDKLNLIVANKSPWSFKDLIIECTFSAQSGTVLGDGEYTIYNTFFGNKSRRSGPHP